MDRQEMIMIIKSIRDDFYVVLQDPPYQSEHRWQTLQATDRLLDFLRNELKPIPDAELSVANSLLGLAVSQATELGQFRAAHQFLAARHSLTSHSKGDLSALGADYQLMANLLRKDINGNHEQTGASGSPGNSSSTRPVHQG